MKNKIDLKQELIYPELFDKAQESFFRTRRKLSPFLYKIKPSTMKQSIPSGDTSEE